MKIPKLFFIFLAGLWTAAFCFAGEKLPEYKGRLNDYAGVISPEYRSRIEALVDDVEAKTSAEIVVATLPSIGPHTESEYAQLLFDQWKIGKAGKDNGVLILIAVQERRWRIHTGYGVEGILPDALCSQIGRERMVPLLKEGKYSEGLYAGTAAVAGVIARDARVQLSAAGAGDLRPPEKILPLWIYLTVFLIFLAWNIPQSMVVGVSMTAIFAIAFSYKSTLLTKTAIAAYLAAFLIRIFIWRSRPPEKRGSFLKAWKEGISDGPMSWFRDDGRDGGGSSRGGGRSGGGGAGGGF